MWGMRGKVQEGRVHFLYPVTPLRLRADRPLRPQKHCLVVATFKRKTIMERQTTVGGTWAVTFKKVVEIIYPTDVFERAEPVTVDFAGHL